MIQASILYVLSLARQRYPSLGVLADHAPTAILIGAVWAGVTGAVVVGLVFGTRPGAWSADEIPTVLQQAIGLAVVLLVLSALGRTRARAIAFRDGSAVASSRGVGSGALKAYVVQTAWFSAVIVFVCSLAVSGALLIATSSGPISLLSAGLAGIISILALVSIALLRLGIAYSFAVHASATGRRGVLLAFVLGGAAGLFLSSGRIDRIPSIFQELGRFLYDVSLGAIEKPWIAALVIFLGWLATVVFAFWVVRILVRRVVGPSATVGGYRQTRLIPGRALMAALRGRLLGAERAEPAFFAVLSIPVFMLSVLGFVAIYRTATEILITGIEGNMLMSLTPLILVTTLGRVLLPVTGADRFGGDLRGIYQSAGARWRSELWAGWILHATLLGFAGVPLLVVVALATDRWGMTPGAIAALLGLVAFTASISVGTSVYWPTPSAGARQIIAGGRGFLIEYAVVAIAASILAAVSAYDPPTWVVVVAGLVTLSLALIGVGLLQRRGVGLWRS